MAPKGDKSAPASAKKMAAAQPVSGKSDAAIILEAYESSLKGSFDTYVTNCVHDPVSAEQFFMNGVRITQKARDRAIELLG